LVEAKSVVARAEAAEKVLADLAGLERGSLSQTAGNYWLPAIVNAYKSRFPSIAVSLQIGNTETVSADVAECVTNLGFIEDEIGLLIKKERDLRMVDYRLARRYLTVLCHKLICGRCSGMIIVVRYLPLSTVGLTETWAGWVLLALRHVVNRR
jgi:DNA-binding transcriptional LysR family regulator